LREDALQQEHFTVTTSINEPGKGRELIMVMTQDEAAERYCPFSMGNDKENCAGSGCMGWKWLPKQYDARTAVGFCGMNA
jgi:hypothetical protein